MRRPRQHSKGKSGPHCKNWVNNLKNQGLNYEIVILEVTSADAVKAAEVWWIAYGRSSGWPLTNITDGGDDNPMYHAEVKSRVSHSARLRFKDPEVKARHLASYTKEVRATMGKHGDDHPAKRPEVRAKIGEAVRLRSQNPEYIAKLRAAHLGKRTSAETKAKLSKINKGRSLKLTPEQLLIKSESAKQAWAKLKLNITPEQQYERHAIRSEASKLAWLKRKNETAPEQLIEQYRRRSESQKRTWAKRKSNTTPEQQKARSDASRLGWITRKAKTRNA
jgi:hypothetical protein